MSRASREQHAWAVLAVAALSSVACVTAPRSARTVDPTPEERSMLGTLQNGAPVESNALEAALIVGGARGDELAQMTQSLDGTLNAVVQGIRTTDPATRGRDLLRALFREVGGRTLLRTYEASATTLYDVMTTGHFNCVAATTLYLLAAARAGLDARPVLLPSHARAVVFARGQSFIVETTTPNGFDPPASVSAAARDRVRPAASSKQVDLYADEKGTVVDWKALLAVTYGNLGIAAQARGDTALAESLLAREAVLTPPAQAPIVRLQQMSLLTELATRSYTAGDLVTALSFARRAFDVAGDATGKRLAEQNIAAIASRSLLNQAERLDDASLTSFARPLQLYPHAYGDVQAIALTLLAERRTKRGDVAGGAEALHEAAALATSDEIRSQADANAILGELNRLSARSTTDPESAWSDWKRLPAPSDPRVASAYQQTGAVIAQNRSIRLSNTGRCPELDAALVVTPGVPNAQSLRAWCHARHGLARADAGDLLEALSELRTAASLDPGEPRHRENLVVMLEKRADQLIHSSKCDEIPPLVAEARALDPTNQFFSDAVEYCHKR